MNKEKELLFVENFIVKPKRERMAYELTNNKKRQNAISRFCHTALDYIDTKKIVYEGDITNVTELIEIVRKYTKEDMVYVISWDEDLDGKSMNIDCAMNKAIDSGMATILVVGNVVFIKTEQEDGAAKSYILKI